MVLTLTHLDLEQLFHGRLDLRRGGAGIGGKRVLVVLLGLEVGLLGDPDRL
jgi:hypothetical protein